MNRRESFISEPNTVPGKKKAVERRSYFAKATNTLNDKTVSLNSLINIVRSTKSGDVTVEENKTDASCYMASLLFSEKEDFMSFFASESKPLIVKLKCHISLIVISKFLFPTNV